MRFNNELDPVPFIAQMHTAWLMKIDKENGRSYSIVTNV